MQKEKEDFKIALISLQEDTERVPPLGLVCLATYLHEKAEIPRKNILVLDNNYSKIEEELKAFSPSLIGFSAMTIDYEKVKEFARRIKTIHNVPFIIGGVHISSLPQSLDPTFDLGVLGEGEETLKEIVEYYSGQRKKNSIKGIVFWDKGKVVIAPPRRPIKDLDELPIPDFKFVKKEYFRKEEIPSISDFGIKGHLMSSRGCPYRCVFCSTSRFWGSMRFHSPDYTALIVKRMIDDFDIDYLKIADDLFTISPQRVREVREAFEKYGILDKIKGIECQPRANLITEELCEEMKKIKVTTLNFGFESGSDRMLKWLKQSSVSVKMNEDAIVMCKKYGFNVYGSLIYGSPGETIGDMKKTNDFIDFASREGATYLWNFVATPFPATPFWNIALERGKVSDDMDFTKLGIHQLDNPLLLDEDIDKTEFKEVFIAAQKKLRKMKIRIITNLIFKHPFRTMGMVIKEPSYYIKRLINQVIKQ